MAVSTPSNVTAAITTTHPFAVDVASGVESGPGIKDPERMRAFFDAARGGRRVSTRVAHRYGPYGGQYVPETLMPALAELEAAWVEAWAAADFRAELAALLRDFAGRPTAAV